MIVDNGLYYLYRHIRLDTNSVFYIGMGKKSNDDIRKGQFTRASVPHGRNFFWHRIVGVSGGYDVDVLIQSDDRDFICQKEIEFIKIYGRRDLSINGTLCNLNDGGIGLNTNKYSIERGISKKRITGSYDKNVERMRAYAKLHNSTAIQCYRKTYLYNLDGLFFKSFKSRRECEMYLHRSNVSVSNSIRDRESCGGYFITDSLSEKIDISLFREKRIIKKIVQISSDFLLLNTFDSGADAARFVDADKANLFTAIYKLKKCKGFYWGYEDSYLQTIKEIKDKKSLPCPEYVRQKARDTFSKYKRENPEINKIGKPIINIETNEIFKSVSKIVHLVSYSKSSMKNKLSGIYPNDTPFRYYNTLAKTQ